ncbi:hypothetical protein KZZ08_00570 [Roseovarius mucosus]|uniref:hypothetical protein n=1 Tax=Roseovarius mucosus TaxID=215743 RepID=UPI001C5FB0F8|nr:hypothetical protein [Roseovarius mucosus]MBW4972089.1 hypothetical protein [Roseovarius mucosus]
MPPKKKSLDHNRLRRIADQVASYPNGPDSELMRLLKSAEGLKSAEVPKGSGITRVTMCGISATATGGEVNALVNWSNKARRILNSAA